VVNPAGTPCKDVYEHGHWAWDWNSLGFTWQYGEDTLVDRIDAAAPRLAGVLQQIHAKAPGAKVLLVGYPSVLPADASTCAGRQPVTAGDVAERIERAYGAQLDSRLRRWYDGLVRTLNPTISAAPGGH